MYIRQQDIKTLELDHLANQATESIETWVKDNNLCNHASWLLPQLVNWFGSWQLYNDGKTTVAKNCTNNWARAIYRISRVKRSLLIRTQTKLPQYGQLTPLLMLGFKRYQGYSYEQFREIEGLEWLLEPDLYESLVNIEPIDLSQNRLLAIRTQGLITKSGSKTGELKNPESTWSLTGIKDTELGNYPKLVQTMVCQIWLAHPKHRNSDMILDPNNWDAMPKPLIDDTSGIVSVSKESAKVLTREILPWD